MSIVLTTTGMDGSRLLRKKSAVKRMHFESFAEFAKWAEKNEVGMCSGFIRIRNEYRGFKLETI